MKPFADRKRCSLLTGALAQLGLNPIRRFAVLAAVVVITSSTLALAQAGNLTRHSGQAESSPPTSPSTRRRQTCSSDSE